MYSGKDGIEYPTGWALNPMAYQHMPNEQVDWAALAQQWIQMKETCPPAAMSVTPQPPPPPPPVISAPSDGEGGEAPMDVEGDVEAPAPPVITPQQWNCPNGWDRTWNSQWGNWGWSQNSGSKTKTPLMPTPEAPYQGYSTGDSNTPGYTTTNNNANQQSFSAGYWSGDDSNSETKSRLPPRGNRFSPSRQAMPQRRGAPHIQRQSQYQMSAEAQDTTQTIDAAKRKQLPAWIREGLEKMEREKQKEMDKQREKKEREEYLFMKKLEEENSAKQSQPDDGQPKMPAKSKFDSESEKSDDEEKEIEKTATKIDKTIKTQVHRIPPPTLLKRSAEEIMKDLMLNVRRTLTEILLEVTDDQIHAIAKEEMSRFKSHQASRGATVASKLQGLSTIGGGLGLGIYGDSSDSESESGVDSRSGTPDRRQREKNGDVTDGQLQETIRRRKAEFEKTSREIETRIAEEERAEQQRAKKEITRTPPRRSPSSSSSSSADGNQRHAESDGESTTTNNRNEQSGHSYKKSSWDNTESKKHSTEKSHREDKKNTEGKTNKHSTKYQTSQESHKSPKKSKIKTSKTSDSSSDSSDSESKDSFLDNNNSESGSDSSSSTSNSSQKSSSNSGSDSSYKRSKKKKRRSSDDSVKEKKRKSKSKKRNKHSDKGSDKYEEDDTPSSSRKKYSREESASTKDIRTTSSRNTLYSPERKSHKSKNSHRSRSRSDDRKSKRYESSSSRYRDRSRERSSYSRDRRSRSRDKKSRSDRRDYRSRSRDRDRSRDRSSRDKRGRSREGRRDRRGDSRSYYY